MKQLTSPFRPLSLPLSLCVIALSACSGQSTVEKQVAAEVQQEQPLPAGAAMAQASREILFDAPSLTPQQKEKLKQLQAKSAKESNALRRELSKNQLVLMKTLVNPKAKDEEIEVLKNRIVDLDRARTMNFLSTLDQAKRILGRRNSDDVRFYRAFLLEPISPEMTP